MNSLRRLSDTTGPGPEPSAPRRGRGRRPADEVRAAVLRSAADLLFEEGIRAVTFERVAAAAGSSKMTLYKWWPSTGALAADAYFSHSEQLLEFPDTGDLRADLHAQLSAFVRLLTRNGAGKVIAELLGAAQSDQNLAEAFSRGYTRPRRELALRALESARDRGELRDNFDLSLLVDQLWGACYNRLLIPDEPLDEQFAQALVDNALDGARPR